MKKLILVILVTLGFIAQSYSQNTDIENRIASLQKEVKNLEDSLDNAEKAGLNNAKVDSLQKEIDNLKESLYNAKIASLYNAKIASLQKEINKLKDSLYNAKIASFQKEVKNLKASLDNAKIASFQKEVKNLKDSLYNAEIASFQKEVNDLKENFYNAKIDSLYNAKIASFQKEVNDLKASLYNAKIASLDNAKIASLQKEIDNLKENLYNAKIVSLDNAKIDSFQKEVKNLKATLYNAKIDSLQENVNELKDSFYNVEKYNKLTYEKNIYENLIQNTNEVNDLTIIKIDFKSKKIMSSFQELQRLKQGDFYQLQVDNINMNLYKVIFDKKDTIIVSNVKFPTFDLVNLGGVKELLEKISTISENSEKKFLLRQDDLILNEKNKINNLLLKINNKINSSLVLNSDTSFFNKISLNISIDNFLVETDSIRQNLISIQTELRREQTKYLDSLGKISQNQLNESDKILKQAFEKSISNAEKLYESINAEKINIWIKELIYNYNNSATSYISLPQQFSGHQTTLDIQLIPIKEEFRLPNYHTKIVFPLIQEFYVGGGMSFYYAGFKNDVYSIKSIMDSDSIINYQITDEKNKKGELGLVALIHLGWRPFYYNKKKNWFSINLVMGPALSLTNTIKPRVAVGGGLSFGRKNMITINGLYMGGYVDKKREIFNVSELSMVKPENITVSKLAGSFSLALGYIYNF